MTLTISTFARSYIRKRTGERMTDACKIYTGGDIVMDPMTGETHRENPVTKYEGPCRFWEVTAGQQVLIGDEQLTMTQAFLSLPFNSVVPESDDVVEITENDDDDLVGRTVSVISVVRGGGLRASRKFMVKVIESQKDTW